MGKQLPAEVIRLILSNLAQKDVVHLLLINHHWFESVASYLYHRVAFRDLKDLDRFLHLFYETAKNRKHGKRGFYSANNYAQWVYAIDFSRVPQTGSVTNDMARRLMEDCQRLETLNFYNCHQLDDQTVRHIITRCPALQHLYLAGATNLTAACLPGSGAVRLKTLHIYMIQNFFYHLSRKEIRGLSRKLPDLRTLKMSDLALNRHATYSDLSQEFPQLQHIWIKDANPAQVLAFLANCTCLNIVELENCRLDVLWLKYQTKAHLASLKIVSYRNDQNYPLDTSLISNFSHLTSLVLTGISGRFISSTQLTQVLCCLPRLKRFFAPSALNDDAIHAMIKHCPSITSLSFSYLQVPISAKAVENALCTYQDSLTELMLVDVNLQTESLDNVLEGWSSKRLQCLLYTCDRLGQSTLSQLPTLYPSLCTLQVNVDAAVTSANLQSMIQSFQYLEAAFIERWHDLSSSFKAIHTDANLIDWFEDRAFCEMYEKLERNFELWQLKEYVW